MLTDKEIKDFLNRDITDEEYQKLVQDYFQQPKDNWYTEKDKDGKKFKNWNPDKVKEFWKLIRKHAMPRGRKNKKFYFRSFVFPDFEKVDLLTTNDEALEKDENFWNEGEKREFMVMSNFFEAMFSGEANFFSTKFTREAVFFRVAFKGKTDFSFVKFLGETDFVNTTFTEDNNFLSATFMEDANFYSATFMKTAYFYHTSFSGEANFSNVTVKGKTDFYHASFSGEKETIFKDITLGRQAFFNFENINFTKKAVFRRLDLTKAKFHQSDITEIRFKSCIWNEDKGRIILQDEQTEDIKLSGLEDLYRQLKKNFESNKDWELSGKAYYSEMEMRRKRFLNSDRNLIKWPSKKLVESISNNTNSAIFWIYKVYSGYTQNYVKPLFILIISTVLIFPFLFYSDWCFFMSGCEWDWTPLRKSFDAAIPLFKPSLEYKYWGLRYLQTFLSTVLLTFFILALRKRFKQ